MDAGHTRLRHEDLPVPLGQRRWATLGSHVEAELHHVAVLHHVVLALHAGLARRAGLGDRARLDQVVEGDDLGLDEALLEVGVDDTGRLGGGGALLDGPGAGFLGAGREVGLQAQGVEADAGEGGEAGLLLADRLEEFQGFLVVELGEVRLELGVEEDRLGRGDQGALLVLEVVVDVSSSSSTLKT